MENYFCLIHMSIVSYYAHNNNFDNSVILCYRIIMPKVTCGFVTRRRIINVAAVLGQAYTYYNVAYAQVSRANITFFLPFLSVRLYC